MSTLTKKVIGFGTATLAASTVGAFMAAAPAQALAISGSVSIDGPADFNTSDPFPMTDIIDFQNEQITDAEGFFTKFAQETNGVVTVADLTLNLDSVSGDTGSYTYDSVIPFITFDDGLQFNLDPGEATREFLGSFAGENIILNFTQLTGSFVDSSGAQVAEGILTAQSTGTENFSIDLTVESVPEPATMLGLGVVAGSLALSRAGKKSKA
jgi:hypothetical protein